MRSDQGLRQRPHLTFACELDVARLTALFEDHSVVEHLQALEASVILALANFCVERAQVVRSLNAAGVPVTAIPLLSLEEGYYFTPDNTDRAAERYQEWKAWTEQENLQRASVGLDIEPEARFYLQIMENPWGLPRLLLPRLRDKERPKRAQEAYTALVDRIHADGYTVNSGQGEESSGGETRATIWL